MSSFFVNANTDTTAISNLLRTQVPLRTTIERLSTGLYVPSTEEDAAGFVVADKVTNVVGVSKTIETTSRLQTADQALGSLQAKLARLRNLAGRAAEESTAEPSLSDEFRSVMGSVDEVASAAGLGKGGELARQLAVNIGNDTPTAVDLSGGDRGHGKSWTGIGHRHQYHGWGEGGAGRAGIGVTPAGGGSRDGWRGGAEGSRSR